ncbi:MAG: HAD family hydrolase [Muribaculaceae bacterium]
MELNNIGVLFDLDGVLIDTESQYSVFWGDMGEKYLGNREEFAARIKGSNLSTILNNNFPDPDLQKDIVSQLDEFQANMSYAIYPGVKEFIQQLVENGIPMCIVTSSDDRKMESLFEQQPYFKEVFRHIITGDMVTKSKPDPECFIKGAELIGADIRRCFVFEDSMQGIAAGKASGATVIALDTTNSREAISHLTHNIISSFENYSVTDMIKYK